MEGKYPLTMGGEDIGTVSVVRQGLYWHITCRCRLTGQVLYKVIASCEGQEENLGLLIPQGEYFGLATKVPVKRLSGTQLQFRAMPRHAQLREKFVPISPQEPFRYIERLKTAYLVRKESEVGIVFVD